MEAPGVQYWFLTEQLECVCVCLYQTSMDDLLMSQKKDLAFHTTSTYNVCVFLCLRGLQSALYPFIVCVSVRVRCTKQVRNTHTNTG